jgi:hypothetical protein
MEPSVMTVGICDAEAMLSCAVARLWMPSPDIAAALKDIAAAREKLIALAFALEKGPARN